MPTPVIIDTDPGVDDVLALLLALAGSPDDIEVRLISVTFGNVEVQNCLRNVVSLFHVLEQELRWRLESGSSAGFQSLQSAPPLVAVGADGPLGDQLMLADYFRKATYSPVIKNPHPAILQTNRAESDGKDGLGGVHESHSHLSAPETWKQLFGSSSASTPQVPTPTPKQDSDYGDLASAAPRATAASPLFRASQRPAHLEILQLLEESPPNTVDIIAIGPLTNVALAASHSPQTLMRAKSVLVMGGAIAVPGNMTPLAEFNTYADTTAAARVYALTSPNPASTMPVIPDSQPLSRLSPTTISPLPPYPPKDELGSKRLKVILFPLDLTTTHWLKRADFTAKIQPLLEKGSPLAEWVNAILEPTFKRMETLHHGHDAGGAAISLHDPLCVWYAMKSETLKDQWTMILDEDVRVETAGQWTRGACIVDRRDRKKRDDPDDTVEGPVSGDTDGWLSSKRGNRLERCTGTPGEGLLGSFMLETIFG